MYQPLFHPFYEEGPTACNPDSKAVQPVTRGDQLQALDVLDDLTLLILVAKLPSGLQTLDEAFESIDLV